MGGRGQKEVKKGKEISTLRPFWGWGFAHKPEGSHLAFPSFVTSHFNVRPYQPQGKAKSKWIEERTNFHPSSTTKRECFVPCFIPCSCVAMENVAVQDLTNHEPTLHAHKEHHGTSCFCLSICERGSSLRSWKIPTFFFSNTWKKYCIYDIKNYFSNWTLLRSPRQCFTLSWQKQIRFKFSLQIYPNNERMKDVTWLSPKIVNIGKLWEVIFNTILILGKTDHGTENHTWHSDKCNNHSSQVLHL